IAGWMDSVGKGRNNPCHDCRRFGRLCPPCGPPKLEEDPPRAAKRAKRSADPDRPGNAERQAVPELLAAGAAGRGASRERLSAGASEAVVRAAAGVSRLKGASRPDRRVLRPSRRVAVVRAQRGERPALSLSRLEV